MNEMSLDAQNAASEFVGELVSSLPILMGIDQFIPGCVVVDVDPYGVAPAFPRLIKVTVRDAYDQDVTWRGNPLLAATDTCTVVHFADGDQYEVFGPGGGAGGGGGVVNWPLGYPTYDGRYALRTLLLQAGSGMTGGGDLTIGRTFNVIGGEGITANPNVLNLTWGAPVIGTIEPDDAANAGASLNPARSDHQHAIVTVVPPVEIDVTSINAEGVATSFTRSDHMHGIDTSSNPGAAASILASDVNGRLELEGLGIGAAPTGQELRIDGNIVFVGAQQISTTIDGLTLAPADGLFLNPAAGDIVAYDDLVSDNWVSGRGGTGWGINRGTGHADFRSIFSEEIRTYAFIADIYSAMAGALIITESRAKVSREFTIPNAGISEILYVEDLEGFENVPVFTANDYVLLRVIDRAADGEGLIVANVFGQVTGYGDLANGEQSWTFTTTTAAYAGADVINAGSIALDYGSVGSGIWEATVLDAAGSPYSQVQTWAAIISGDPATFTTHVRTGNLDGLAGVGAEYGLYAGQGLAVGDSYLLLTDSQVHLHNLPLEVHDGVNTVFLVDPTTPSYALGTSVPTDFDAGTGVWAGLHGGLYKWRVGDPSGIRVEWDGAEFSIFDGSNTVVFEVDANGAWLSNLAISSEFGQQYFTAADGSLLFGPYCELTSTTWTTLRGQVAAITGAMHTSMGRWAGTQALVVEAGTENFVENPIFNANITDGWHKHSGIDAAWDSAHKFIAGGSMKTTAGGAGVNTTYNIDNFQAVANGDFFTIHARVWRAPGGAASIQIRDRDAGTFYASAACSLYEKWEWITCTWENDTGVAKNVELRLYNSTQDGVTEVWFDACQAEAISFATTLCYGDLGWCAWSGTAHDSTSTRVATTATFNPHGILDLSLFSMSIWFQMPCDAGTSGLNLTRGVFRWWDVWNTNSIYLNFNADMTTIGVTAYDGGVNQLPGFTANLTGSLKGDWHQLLVTVTDAGAGEANLYLDGVLEDTDTSYVAPTIVSTSGYIGFGSTQFGGAIAELAIFNSVLTAAEAGAIYQSQKPLADAGATDTPGIYILDGKFRLASSLNADRIELTSDEIAGYSGGVKQFYIEASTGAGVFGAGDVTLDATGMIIVPGVAGTNTIRWIPDGDALAVGYIRCAATGTLNPLTIYAGPGNTGDDSQILVVAQGAAGTLAQTASIQVEGDVTPQIDFETANISRVTLTTALLDVNIAADFSTTVDIHGALDMNAQNINNINNLDVNGNVDVEGTSDFNDAMTLHGTLNLSGNNINNINILDVNSAIDLDGTMDVSGVVDFHSVLNMNSADIDNVDKLEIENMIHVESAYTASHPGNPPVGSVYLYLLWTDPIMSWHIKFSNGNTYTIQSCSI